MIRAGGTTDWHLRWTASRRKLTGSCRRRRRGLPPRERKKLQVSRDPPRTGARERRQRTGTTDATDLGVGEAMLGVRVEVDVEVEKPLAPGEEQVNRCRPTSSLRRTRDRSETVGGEGERRAICRPTLLARPARNLPFCSSSTRVSMLTRCRDLVCP